MTQPPLWAPWRIEYILAPKDHTKCVFCEYGAHDVDAFRQDHTLVATDDAFVTLNRYPFAAGHLLVIPKRHTSDLAGLGAGEYTALFDLVGHAVARVRAALSPAGVNIGVNLGEAAGAGIAEHLHVHIVPRWNGDTNFMPVLADVRVIPQALDDTWEKLRPYFADIAGGRLPAP